MPGDPLDIFGFAVNASSGWCKPLKPYYFLSEGDNVAYNPLIVTGIQQPDRPDLGGWGGRCTQNTTSPNLWTMVSSEKSQNGSEVADYTTSRWMAPIQNDFAARMQWTVTPEHRDGNHPPSVTILNGGNMRGVPGSNLTLESMVDDPDGDDVVVSWWQYFEEGTYPGRVTITQSSSNSNSNNWATATIPTDAEVGQSISIILAGKDSGRFPLTRYDRVVIEVI